MADVGDNNFVRYIYRGEEDEVIPLHATHITVQEDVTFVLACAFHGHDNIIEVIFHDKIERIESAAFFNCPRLRQVIMPGVTIVEDLTFAECEALTDVECGKLEIIQEYAFVSCESLTSINLPSARIVKYRAFKFCTSMTDVKFGNKLERIEKEAFRNCLFLELITIPLKDGIITDDGIFKGCENLSNVDLVESDLHETIAALHLEGWKNDMHEVIDSINLILRNAPAGGEDDALEIRGWITSVIINIIHYQAEHQYLLSEAATTVQFALPQDIVMDNVLPFLELPSYRFEVSQEDE